MYSVYGVGEDPRGSSGCWGEGEGGGMSSEDPGPYPRTFHNVTGKQWYTITFEDVSGTHT